MNPARRIGLLPIALGFHLLAGPSLPLHAGMAMGLQQVTEAQRTDARYGSGPVARFPFDGTIRNATATPVRGVAGEGVSFVSGLDGQALSLSSDTPPGSVTFDWATPPFDAHHDFSVQFWMRTVVEPDRQFVVLSQKGFPDNSLGSQKEAGWVFYVSGGTWAWNMGSGTRRITYERDNGLRMPLNDGRWHQLTMTYSSARAEVRLFYDGQDRAWYNVTDAEGFDFTNISPMVVGWNGTPVEPRPGILPAIEAGAEQLQKLVDAFDSFGLSEVEPDDFVHLIVDPERLFERKVDEGAARAGADSLAFRRAMAQVDWEPVTELESALMTNPYTIHQAVTFMETAPLMKVYALVDGKVIIRQDVAQAFAEKERLTPPDFDMDDFAVWDRVLSPEEVRNSYASHFKPVPTELDERRASITVGAWNIFHGGRHFTVEDHGWDSRLAIAEIIRREEVDIVMMQETYSSGDFIAAELGYYFATTVDWDYLNQGANISVLSRFPIKEVHVQEDSPFMNMAVKVAVSETQDAYAMSNWYGMQQFPAVFDFHQSRFQESDRIPTFFAGDFNAVPHTDGGDSPASLAMMNAGFTDAYRILYPDAGDFPGHSHRSGRRIDQLYFKGAGLKHTSAGIVSTWPTGFPSDHYLILATFDLEHSTPASGHQK